LRPFRGTRPLPQEIAFPCRSGLVSRFEDEVLAKNTNNIAGERQP